MIAEGLLCLAMNIYYESRSEPLIDQVATAAVTMNRVGDKDFSNSICGVVYQSNQFEWTKNHHKKLKESDITNKIDLKSFIQAKVIAKLYLEGLLKNPIGSRKYFSRGIGFKTKNKPIKLTRKSKHIYY